MAEEGEPLAWQTTSYYVKIKSTFVDMLGTLRAQDIVENRGRIYENILELINDRFGG